MEIDLIPLSNSESVELLNAASDEGLFWQSGVIGIEHYGTKRPFFAFSGLVEYLYQIIPGSARDSSSPYLFKCHRCSVSYLYYLCGNCESLDNEIQCNSDTGSPLVSCKKCNMGVESWGCPKCGCQNKISNTISWIYGHIKDSEQFKYNVNDFICDLRKKSLGDQTKETRSDLKNEGIDIGYSVSIEEEFLDISIAEAIEKSDSSNSSHLFAIGARYLHGIKVKKNYKKAIEWLQKSADLGEADAMFNLGLIYYQGTGVKKNYKKAIVLLKGAESKGVYQAAFIIGMMYVNATGVKRNLGSAREYFNKAVSFNMKEAAYSLAMISIEESDDRSGFKWMLLAAKLGSSEAQYYLSLLYQNGKGVLESYKKSYAWLLISEANGYQCEEMPGYKKSLVETLGAVAVVEAQDLAESLSKEIELEE